MAIDRDIPDFDVSDGSSPTDHVLIESWSLIHHRIGKHAAKRFWELLREGVADVEIVGAADMDAAGGEF